MTWLDYMSLTAGAASAAWIGAEFLTNWLSRRDERRRFRWPRAIISRK